MTVSIGGCVTIAVALLLNPFTIIRLFRLEAMYQVIIPAIIACEVLLAGTGLLLIIFRRRAARKLPEFALAAGTVLLMLMLFEATFTFILHHPVLADAMPATIEGVFRSVYNQGRHIIIFDPACAQYDQEFYYTLKPGICRYRNIEFDTTYHINSAGFRDDESSLSSPEIAVLGDSTTMGWGVEQEETFAQIIERETGRKTINTGVASYGTVREVLTLDRFDQDSLEFVIIQYDLNDIGENLHFLENSNISRHTEEEYEFWTLERQKDERTFFGKNTLLLAYRFLSLFSPPGSYERTQEVEAFLNALALRDWTGKRVLVLTWDPTFGENLRNELAARPLPYVTIVDISGEYNETHQFILDMHFNAAGHRLAADRLMEAMTASD